MFIFITKDFSPIINVNLDNNNIGIPFNGNSTLKQIIHRKVNFPKFCLTLHFF